MYIIGLDIGGTKCAVIIGEAKNGEIRVLEKQVFATNTNISGEEMIKEFYPTIKEYLNTYKAECIGISCGGPLDSKSGTILCPPNLPNLKNFKIVKMLKKDFKVPVFLQNDANACALAEWLSGAGDYRGYSGCQQGKMR